MTPRRLVPPLIILLLACLFFSHALLHPHQMVATADSDLVRVFSFLRYFATESLHRYGEWPLWNPYSFSGFPFFADVQTLSCYPTFLLQIALFPPDQFLGIHILIHLFLAGFFMYLFARGCETGPAGALAAGIAFMFCVVGPLAAAPEKAAAASWIPLVFLLLKKLLAKGELLTALWLGVCLALQFLCGFPQTVYYTVLFMVVYAACQAGVAVKRLPGVALLFLLALLTAGLLSAVQLLPAQQFARLSTRAAGMGIRFISYNSLTPDALIGCALPRFLGGGGEYYIGPLVLLLALTGCISHGGRQRRAVIIVMALSVLIALGKYTPLTWLLYHVLPGFDRFRASHRTMVFFIFGMSLFAGWGVQYLVSLPREPGNGAGGRRVRIQAICLALMAILFYHHGYLNRAVLRIGELLYNLEPHGLPYAAHTKSVETILDRTATHLSFLAGILSLSLCFLMLSRRLRSKGVMRVVLPAMLLLFLFDAGAAYLPIVRTEPPDKLLSSPEITSILAKDGDTFRYLDTGDCRALPSAIAIRHHLEDAGGYLALLRGDYLEFTGLASATPLPPFPTTKLPLFEQDIDAIRHFTIIDLLNIKYLLSPTRSSSTHLRPVATIRNPAWNLHWPGGVNFPETIYIYHNPSALPRAFIVPRARVVRERKELFRELAHFNPREEVLLECEAEGMEEGEPYRPVPIRRYSPRRIGAEMSLQKPGFLVFSELFYPGWRAFDKGSEIPLIKGNHILRCVRLGPGRHSVELVFTPPIWRVGLFISLSSCLCVFTLMLRLRRG